MCSTPYVCILYIVEEKYLQQLISLSDLGDRSRSQLLRYVRALANETNLDDLGLRELWMKCLPANSSACLATRTCRTSLDDLAEVADRNQVLYVRSTLHSAETPIPSPSIPKLPEILTKPLKKK
nr:hypothetical transcript [Hymenolepis microstoma]